DQGVGADVVAAHDGGVGPDRGAPPDPGLPEFVLALDLRARVQDVGEHAGRPAEDPVLQRDPFVQADVVLDLAAIAHRHVGPDHHVLPDDAVPPDPASLEDVTEVPDLGAGADRATLVDAAGFVNVHIGRRRAGQPGCPAGLHRALGGIEHPEHAHAFGAVGARALVAAHALEEMLALESERLGGL